MVIVACRWVDVYRAVVAIGIYVGAASRIRGNYCHLSAAISVRIVGRIGAVADVNVWVDGTVGLLLLLVQCTTACMVD